MREYRMSFRSAFLTLSLRVVIHRLSLLKVGIGLRIVKNTMDLHHGQVILDSEPGKGSTFVLLIPEGKSHFTGDLYEIVDYRGHETEPQFQPLSVQEKSEEGVPGHKENIADC